MPRALRSFTLDTSVTAHKLAPGTIRRIIGFARPYRGWLVAFLALIVVDALAGAAGPLIYRAIIDQGIAEERPELVVALAGLVALLALVSAIGGLYASLSQTQFGDAAAAVAA
jgi:ATP-binding cassette subfamily B protein